MRIERFGLRPIERVVMRVASVAWDGQGPFVNVSLPPGPSSVMTIAGTVLVIELVACDVPWAVEITFPLQIPVTSPERSSRDRYVKGPSKLELPFRMK